MRPELVRHRRADQPSGAALRSPDGRPLTVMQFLADRLGRVARWLRVRDGLDQEAVARVDDAVAAAGLELPGLQVQVVAVLAAGEPDELAGLDPLPVEDGDPAHVAQDHLVAVVGLDQQLARRRAGRCRRR